MAREAYLVELYPNELASLGFLAGLLAAQGHDEGKTLSDILQRIQVVEVEDLPEDEVGSYDETEDEESSESVVEDENAEDEAGYSNIDPESLGIQVNLPPPPPPPPPARPSSDFGAGPGPA